MVHTAQSPVHWTSTTVLSLLWRSPRCHRWFWLWVSEFFESGELTTHTIHGTGIFTQNLVDFYGKCRCIYSLHGSYGQGWPSISYTMWVMGPINGGKNAWATGVITLLIGVIILFVQGNSGQQIQTLHSGLTTTRNPIRLRGWPNPCNSR